MNPSVEAAWIAGSSGLLGVLVGVTGTVLVPRLGFQGARDATAAGVSNVRGQIEADRRNRIWEKQAAVYTDLIAEIQLRRESRRVWMNVMLTETEEPSEFTAPVEWSQLRARLFAFASPAVINASRLADDAGTRFSGTLGLWSAQRESARRNTGLPLPAPPEGWPMVTEAFVEANHHDDALIELMRTELHAGFGEGHPLPVPIAPPQSAAD